MADRVGVISHGKLIVVEEKAALMQKLGKRQLTLHLQDRLDGVPPQLAEYGLELSSDGTELVYTYDSRSRRTGIATLLRQLVDLGIGFKDLQTSESSLEEIFISLVHGK